MVVAKGERIRGPRRLVTSGVHKLRNANDLITCIGTCPRVYFDATRFRIKTSAIIQECKQNYVTNGAIAP